MPELLPELEEIFRGVLDDPQSELSRGSNASTVEGSDSLAHVNLETSIERHYRIKFGLGELQFLKDVGEMEDLIQAKLAAKRA